MQNLAHAKPLIPANYTLIVLEPTTQPLNQFTAQPSIIKASSAEFTRWIRLVDENYKLTYFIRIMASLRTSNRYLAEKNAGQISQQIKVRAYDSSVFEGVRLRRGHALAALSIASRKKTAKAR